MTARKKIYIILGLWVMVCLSMAMYFFNIYDSKNRVLIGRIEDSRRELGQLETEQSSFQLARQDLELMSKKPYQPENFFSKDVTLVNEIKYLEDLGERLNIDLTLSGISGTVKSAPKAKTIGSIVTVPYSISVVAPFSKVVEFLEILENLDFITNVSSLSLSAVSENKISASLTANFYLRGQ
jgi:hypothetical protein